MKRILLSATLMAGAAAQADTLIIDNFTSGDQLLSFGAGSAVGSMQTDTNAQRTLTTTLTATSAPISSRAQVAADFGVLDLTNGSGENSIVQLGWQLGASLVPTTASDTSFYLSHVSSDPNPIDVTLSLNGTVIGSYALPGNTDDATLSFSIASSLLNAGGLLTLSFAGQTGWDLTAGSVGINYAPVPEPASYALLGVGLLGLGLMRRARRAQE